MFTFKYELDKVVNPMRKLEMTIDPKADIHDLLDCFGQFLQGAGYVFEGSIEIVKPEPTIKQSVVLFDDDQGVD